MKPIVKEFTDDAELIKMVQSLARKGISKDKLYIMAHDDKRTNRVTDEAEASKVGLQEEGVTAAVGNIFRSQGDELRKKLKELGFNQHQANRLEEKLDQGIILLINMNRDF